MKSVSSDSATERMECVSRACIRKLARFLRARMVFPKLHSTLYIVLLWFWLIQPVNAQIFEKLAQISPSGRSAAGNLSLGPDGSVYGVTMYGGNADCGVLFRHGHSTAEFSELAHFGGNVGLNPRGKVAVDDEGNIYGLALRQEAFEWMAVLWRWSSSAGLERVASLGGLENANMNVAADRQGRIYSVVKGVLQRWSMELGLEALANVNDLGGLCDGTLAVDPDGNVYGTNRSNNVNVQPLLWRWNSSGLQKLGDLPISIYGATPQGATFSIETNALYGVVADTGFRATGAIGSLWRWTDDGGIQKLSDFDSSPHFTQPAGQVAVQYDGAVFGVSQLGGATGKGAVWRWTAAYGMELYSDLASRLVGISPAPGVVSNGWGLLGVTLQGGSRGQGTIWGCAPPIGSQPVPAWANCFSEVNPFGHAMTGVVAADDGSVYGLRPSNVEPGALCRYHRNSYEAVTFFKFPVSESREFGGSLIGTDARSILYGLMREDDGGRTLWRMTPTTGIERITSFNIVSPNFGGVVRPDGTVYGTADGGLLWRWTESGGSEVIASFAGLGSGYKPASTFTVDGNGDLWGVAYGLPNPVLWRWNLERGVEKMADLPVPGYMELYPLPGITVDHAGNVYGLRADHRPSQKAFLWRWNAGDGYVELESITQGVSPSTGLTVDDRGQVYGTCFEGGHFNCGTVWKWRDSTGFETLRHLSPEDGVWPESGKLDFKNGRVYGMANCTFWSVISYGAMTSVSPATDVTVTSAKISGRITVQGIDAAPVFKYWPSGHEGIAKTIPATAFPLTKNGDYEVSAELTGLSPHTAYGYALEVSSEGYYSSARGGFQTANTPPVAGALKIPLKTNHFGETYGVVSSADLLAQVSDADGDQLEIVAVYDGRFGSTYRQPISGKVTYSAGGLFGRSDTFEYMVRDGFGGTATGFVTVEIDAPLIEVKGFVGRSFSWGGGFVPCAEIGEMIYGDRFLGKVRLPSGELRHALFSMEDGSLIQVFGLTQEALVAPWLMYAESFLTTSGGAILGIERHGSKRVEVLYTPAGTLAPGDRLDGRHRWRKCLAFDGHMGTIFVLGLVEGPGITALNNRALVAISYGRTRRILLRTGQMLDGRRIASLTTLVGSPGSLSENRWRQGPHTCLVKLGFSDGSSALYSVSGEPYSETKPVLEVETGKTSGGLNLLRFGLPATASSDLAFHGRLRQGRGIGLNNDTAVFRTGVEPVTFENAEILDASGVAIPGVRISKFGDPLVGHGGRTIVRATYRGKTVKASNREAFVELLPDGFPRQIARIGDAADGGGNWCKFLSAAATDQPGGGLLFTAMLAGDPLANIAHGTTGLWAEDSDGRVRLLLRTGQEIEAGARLKIKSFRALQTFAGDPRGFSSAYSENHRVFVLATLEDGTKALLQIRIP